MKRFSQRIFAACFCAMFLGQSAFALEPWEEALSKMPLKTNITEINKTNAVTVMLGAFQENSAAKALVIMPGATDEFYFFNRGTAKLTNANPTLLDAIVALTNQTLIQATFRPPFILLHSAEDPLEPAFTITDEKMAERIRNRNFDRRVLFDDRDWDFILPKLSFWLDTKIVPEKSSHDSSHFYRHSFAAYDLTGWEALEAVAFAGKTEFTIQKKKIIFSGDTRFRARPKVPENYPVF